jgi:4-amino-4-deoxy-L-arabinose transferase-like glycosyltransferase
MPRVRRMTERALSLLRRPRAAVVVLVAILALSLAARLFDISAPCTRPCRTVSSHTLIFDESYYVNAARVIAGINPPAGAPYHDAPLGHDPNAEHPQLAKLIMAAGITVFGDDPIGWRIGSVLFGMLALVALYALVRAAGGSRWLSVGVVAVMASDNLLLVHGRIGTLDIYAVALMLVAATLYMRRNATLAGIVLGVAACTKLVALYLIFVLVLLELLRALGERKKAPERRPWLREHVVPLALCAATTAISLIAVLWLMDVTVPPWDPSTKRIFSDPFSHLGHMISVGFGLKALPDATGISSTPLQWLVDQKPIDYARVAVNSLAGGKIIASRAVVAFRGEINPFISFLLFPALAAALAAALRERDRLATLGAAWCVGTFAPFLFASVVSHRISYLYYMVIVMPGVYIVTTRLFANRRLGTAAAIGWAIALIYGFVDLYPLRTLSGH